MNIFQRIRASERLRAWSLGGGRISVPQSAITLQAHRGRWHRLQARAARHGLFTTFLTVGGLTLLVKFLAAAKEVVIARQLGVGDALDAFLIAYSLPALTMNIIATSFSCAMIPAYVQIRGGAGAAPAQRFFSGAAFWGLGLLILASALLALLFPLVLPLLVAGFSPGKMAVTQMLFWTLLPIVTVTGLETIWSAVLNVEGEFAVPAAAPIITSAVVAGVLVFGVRTWGAWGLAGGTLAGACLEAALIGGRLRRRGVSLRPRWHGMDADLRRVIHQHAPLAAATLVFGGSVMTDQAVAARLGPGSVAALSYGGKIVAMVIGVASTAVGTSVLPHFSRLVAGGDWTGLRRDMKRYTLLILLALVPLALLMISFSLPIVRAGFQRGAFTAQDTGLVARVQACLALQIPFYTMGMMYLRLLSALKMNSRTLAVSTGGIVLNVILDIAFARFLGIAGIALSTTVVSVASAAAFYAFLLRDIARAEAAGRTQAPTA